MVTCVCVVSLGGERGHIKLRYVINDVSTFNISRQFRCFSSSIDGGKDNINNVVRLNIAISILF